MSSWKDSIWFQIILLVLGGIIGAYVNVIWISLTLLVIAIIGLIVSNYCLRKTTDLLPTHSSQIHPNQRNSPIRSFRTTIKGFLSKIFNAKNDFQIFVPARELDIFKNHPDLQEEFWTWSTSVSSRSPKVAKLLRVSYLDIRGSINKSELHLKSTYTAWFIFKLEPDRCGLETPFQATVHKIKGDIIQSENVREVSLESGHPITDDGWLELPFGDFSIEDDDNFDSIKVRLHASEEYEFKKGLIVDGIDFRYNKDRSM